MTTPTFPSYARFVLDGYDETPNYGVIRSDTDSAIAKQRQRWTAPIKARNVTLLVNNLADKMRFDTFFGGDLGGGAGWFNWTDIDGVTKMTRFVSGALKWTSPGGVWLATVQLETLS